MRVALIRICSVALLLCLSACSEETSTQPASDNGGGEMMQPTATNLECAIDGAQNVPPNMVPGNGTGTFVLNADQTEVTYHIEYSGLVGNESDAHIHNATPRDNGPIVLQLPTGSPKDGAWQIPSDLVIELLEGRLYVNIHTDAYVQGELRGNITVTTTP